MSIGAFLISIVSFYFTYFYESHKLEVVVIEADPSGSQLDIKVAIINPGNRKALISEAYVLINSGENTLIEHNALDEIKLNNELPLIVEPNSIAVISFEGHLSPEDLYAVGQKPINAGGLEEFNGEATKRVEIAVHFESMDFKGNLLYAKLNPLIVYVTTKDFAGWHVDSGIRYLFEK